MAFSIGVRSQVDDWKTRGIIDASLAEKLNSDLDARKSANSFGSIAIILGVICLAFGAISFVAANWDEMSRMMRLIILVLSMIASYGIASVFDGRGRRYFAQAFVLLGCAIFGATVMLVGQMYHLSGHGSGAILLWALGTLAAALLTLSVPSLVLGTGLATLWSCWYMLDNSGFNAAGFWYLPLWLACAGMAWYLASRFAAHVCALALHAWFIAVLIEYDVERSLPVVAAATISIALAAISALFWSGDTRKLLKGFEPAAVFHLVLVVLVQLIIWYLARSEGSSWLHEYSSVDLVMRTPVVAIGAIALIVSIIFFKIGSAEDRLDHALCIGWIAATLVTLFLTYDGVPFVVQALLLGFTIWVIRMGTRQESVSITRLGYLSFIIAMLMIYAEAAGGLLGTSLFYIIAGLLLVAGALIAPRISGRHQGKELEA